MSNKNAEQRKRGRPPKDDPITVNVNIAMPLSLVELTSRAAKDLGLSRSAFVRYFFLQGLQAELDKGDFAFLDISLGRDVDEEKLLDKWRAIQRETRRKLRELGFLGGESDES